MVNLIDFPVKVQLLFGRPFINEFFLLFFRGKRPTTFFQKCFSQHLHTQIAFFLIFGNGLELDQLHQTIFTCEPTGVCVGEQNFIIERCG
jgi:hypothetical protein